MPSQKYFNEHHNFQKSRGQNHSKGAVCLWNIVRTNTFFTLTRSNFVGFSIFFLLKDRKNPHFLKLSEDMSSCLHMHRGPYIGLIGCATQLKLAQPKNASFIQFEIQGENWREKLNKLVILKKTRISHQYLVGLICNYKAVFNKREHYVFALLDSFKILIFSMTKSNKVHTIAKRICCK